MPAGKTYIKIATQTLASTSTSVTFSNLPQNYTDLVLVFNTRDSRTELTDGLAIRFNNDSGNNYFETRLSTESSGTYFDNFNRSYINSYGTNGGSAASTVFGLDVISVMNYSNSSMCKTLLLRGNPSGYASSIGSGVWNNTSPITSINITPGFAGSPYNFASGSTFTIYGIECAKNPYATGGDKIYTTGTHWVHEFYNSGLFVPRQNLTADYLVIAGGGGGGGNQGGGGGAGGFRSTVTATGGGGSLESALSLSGSTAYTVTIGGGGVGGTVGVNGIDGTNGSNSVFSTITSTGGGGGAGSNFRNGLNGGSGGGGAYQDTVASTGTANQGFAGGRGVQTPGPAYTGGGGGAGAVGGNGTGSAPGNGGAGVATSITGSSITYAGGGGGNGGSGGTGGSGGGGNGQGGSAATSGSTNTGSGGGGGNSSVGNGGSGIVIVRYAI